MRNLPDVPLSDVPDGYAHLAGQGWDTVQEAFALKPTDLFIDLLNAGQRRAKDASDDGEGVALIELNGEVWKAHAAGSKGGFKWRISNDDLVVMIASAQRQWSISVRYLSAGLWEHGWEPLRTKVFETLRPYTRQEDMDCVRVSRVDWCFDFYSPQFMADFDLGLTRNLVGHSSAKTHEIGEIYSVWGGGGKGQTIEHGTKAGLQVSAYDKTREIDEASGKTWLYAVWRHNLGFDPWADGSRPKNVVRLELRYSGEYLKSRNLRRPHEVTGALSELVTEALYTRRLTVPPTEACAHCGSQKITDSNRGRWPLHPLWVMAWHARGSLEMVPLGRKVTGRRDALAAMADKQIAGAIRSATILKFGEYTDEKARDLAIHAQRHITADPQHDKKAVAAMDRYSDVEDAR